MNEVDKKYLLRLRALCETIQDKFDYEVFYLVCKRFMEFKQGNVPSKNVTKQELLERLVEKGLMQMRYNDYTGCYDKLPDDRSLRASMRELLKNGFPIITTSHEGGCFIVESEDEVDKPQKENHSRAVAILAVDKGYRRVREFLKGGENYGSTPNVCENNS